VNIVTQAVDLKVVRSTVVVCLTNHWPDRSGLPYPNADHESRVSVVLHGSAVSSPRCAQRTLRNPQTARTTIPLWR